MLCSDCGKFVRPVVAIDIDGTLANYHGHFLAFMQLYLDRALPHEWDGSGDWEEYLGLSREEYREAKLAYRQGGWKRMMPMYSGARNLARECMMAGAELWITTTRPWLRLDSVDPDTREWLRRHDIPYDFLLYDDDKYGKLAKLVDEERVVAVLDDLPDQISRAREVFGWDVGILRRNRHNRRLTESWEPVARHLPAAKEMILQRLGEWLKTHESGMSASGTG